MNKLAIIGYGKMGKSIEKFAEKYGFEICSIIDISLDKKISPQNLNGAEVAVEFTTPAAAANNIISLFEAGVNVVSGTTGWESEFQKVIESCKKNKRGFFHSTNFSIGMNITFQLNKYLAEFLNKINGYQISISETHHTQKLDKPSGTAVTLANEIIRNTNQYSEWKLDHNGLENNILPVYSKREGSVIGLHTIKAESRCDIISLQHEALNRDGFTFGALLACKFILNKTGVFNMNDLLFKDLKI